MMIGTSVLRKAWWTTSGALLQSAGAGRFYVVALHRLDDVHADEPQHDPRDHESERHRREDEVGEEVRQVPPLSVDHRVDDRDVRVRREGWPG